MEELEHPGVIRIFDYSDTKELFWIATQPAKVDKLSKRFDFLASQSFQFRQVLVRQFLTILQWIHNSHVVHRNLSGDAIFLSSELEIYIGDFGFACYFTDQPTTRRDTTLVTTTGYQPPEVRNAETFTCNVSCDIYSAGLLAFEILSATALPKDNHSEIHEVLRVGLDEQVAKEIIGTKAAEAILKATNPSPEKRWSTAEDFANALEESLQDKSAYGSTSVDLPSTIRATTPLEPSDTIPGQTTTESVQKPSQPTKIWTEVTEGTTPLDPLHEIWNNRYEIIEKIGEGGQAIVYKAYDHLTNEEIAIKTIWSRHREDRAAINRLKQGAMIARSLTHRYIIKTYSVEQRIEADGTGRYVFICMELIKSQLELSHVIEIRKAAGKKIRVDEALHITRQLLDALIYAHEHTIHRDIKPGNIMLVPHQEQEEIDTSDLTKFDIRLIDFGIAKVLSQKHIDVTGKGFRSAYYGAPELADAKTGVDARADIFSVGVTLYQMLTKNIPRKGSPPANKVNKEVPAALARVIDKAINADREKRFKTVSEFAKEIERAVSKFNWLRKAVKIAAAVLIGLGITAAVKHFLPEPDYVPVQQSKEILESRIPDKEIATFANGDIVKFTDIEGYDSYNILRKSALVGLQTVELAGLDKFKRSFPIWKEQEEIWFKVEPAVHKVKKIAQDQRQCNEHKDLAIAEHLMKLEPSSEIVLEVKDKVEKAESLLEVRPLSQNILEICADSYDLGAKVYTNIGTLADGSDTPDTAEQINDELKNVGKLRSDFLYTHESLDTIKQLKDYDFDEHREKCLNKADNYYRSFELPSAKKYFSLLNQICGTITYVQDRINFKRSDIGLVVSRLMVLCYEDIGTFEDYPEWKGKLEQVYRRKDILAKYTSIQTLLSKSPNNVPLTIYDRIASARKLYEQDNLDSASAQLGTATKEYKKFIRRKIDDLTRDCHSLLTFSSISTESIESCKAGLEKLSNSIDEPGWPQADFADEYNNYSKQITSEKNTVRRQLMQQALDLKKKIINSSNKAQQHSIFWKSRLISKYTTAARKYDADDIDASIANWKYVENLPRLSEIVNGMRNIRSRLDKMWTRKDQLDRLADGIDEGISFCEEFKGISSEERKKYKQWGLDLKQLRSKLTAQQKNTYLIDQSDEIFDAEYKSIQSAFSEIRAKLPYHRSRVIELINKTHFIEKDTSYLRQIQQLWADVLGKLSVPEIKDFDKIRAYLESIKEDVDKWSRDNFNRQMRDNCKIIADALDEQAQAVANIVSRVLQEKSRLIEATESFKERVSEILTDEDVRRLDDIAATDKREALLRFRQLSTLLSTQKQKFSHVVLGSVTGLENVMPQDTSADFEVDSWLVKFNTKKNQLDAQISQLRGIEGTVSIFQETRQILAQQSSIETNYYLGLRDYTTSLIDYSDPGHKIDAIEADSVAIKMCNFLEQMKNKTLPRLEDLKASLGAITKDLANLKSMKISTLPEAKDFNRKREHLLNRIATLQQDLGKLNRTSLEVSCKQTITRTVDEITSLIGNPNETETLSKLTSSLWSFFPDHKDWRQWGSFLKLYHIVVSDEHVRLASSGLLRPANEKGDALSLSDIAANPSKAFHTNAGDSANFGWPRYIRHQKDPTVILAFIPRIKSAGTEPFYMVTREITNAQYKLFMEKTSAKSTTNLAGWSYFCDQNNKLLIGQVQGQFPPCKITWDKSAGAFVVDEKFKHDPVTWVTSYGGQAYAQWFGAQLPTVPQHAHAARAGASTTYPWGDELSNVVSYAHVRSAAWKNAAREYNAKRDNPVEIAYPPVGAVKDFLRGEALDPARTIHTEHDNHSVWPCSTKNRPNTWGLYDMVGNVWEWCTDTENNSTPVICGGSCLCPPQYISPESKYEFKAQACDVGFRIVITEQLQQTIPKADTALESAQSEMKNFKEFTDDERIDRIISNITEVSVNLKLTAQEVRRAPWKLLYKSKQKEFKIQALVDSAGAFAAGAERLDSTALRLQKLMAATDDKLQVDKDKIESMVSELETSFEQFQKAEKKFWEELE
jgi:serine/threonine protein kinase/formylglycine-generating enzyme required for sulfatase activity